MTTVTSKRRMSFSGVQSFRSVTPVVQSFRRTVTIHQSFIVDPKIFEIIFEFIMKTGKGTDGQSVPLKKWTKKNDRFD